MFPPITGPGGVAVPEGTNVALSWCTPSGAALCGLLTPRPHKFSLASGATACTAGEVKLVPRLLPSAPPRPRPRPRALRVLGAVADNWCGTPSPCRLSGPADNVDVKADIAGFPSCCTTFPLFPRPLVDLLLLSRPVPCSPLPLPPRLLARGTTALSLFVEVLGSEFA